jgi:glutathione S-transferase
MADLEIIGHPASNYVWVCRMACAEKGVPYRLTVAMPHSPEINTIHPLGKMPVMRHGDVTLAESRAICLYIDRAFSGAPLVPADLVPATQVEQWLSLVNTAVDPICVRQYLVAYMFPGTPDGSPNRGGIDAALPKMEKQFQVLNQATARGHLVGDSFTLADINLLPILFYLKKFPESAALFERSPNLAAYYERHFARKSVQDTIPQEFPDQLRAAQSRTDATRAA